MCIFTKMRQLLSDNTRILHELAEMRFSMEKITRKQDGYDQNVELIFEYIDRLERKVEKPSPMERAQVGYKIGGEDKGD